MGLLVITRVPIGGLDSDTEDAKVEAVDYRDAVNVRNSYTYINIQKTAGPLKGNVLVEYDLGNVYHRCLGTIEDKKGESVIYYLWSEDGQHKILRYYIKKITPTSPYGSIENVITFPFPWERNTTIHSSDIVNNELLYFVDPVPRLINLEKANITYKKKSWRIHLPISYVVPTNDILITVKDYYTGNNVGSAIVNTVAGQTIAEALKSIADQINNGLLSQFLEAESCGCSLLITEKEANKYKFVIDVTDFVVTAENWYGPNPTLRFFDAAKWAPGCQPNYQYGKDATRNFNKVNGHVWQFRLAYEYDNHETSAMGPISQIAVNNEVCNEVERNLFNNCIIEFNNADCADPNMWVILKKVILYVRDRNAGNWRKVVSLDPCDYYDVQNGNRLGTYIFDNILQTQSVDDVFSNLLYDRMPREANSQKVVSDRIVYAGLLDDYDTPECAELNTQVTYGEVKNPEYFDVTFIIRICNPSFDGSPKNDAGIGKMPYIVGVSELLNDINILQRRGCVLRNENEAYSTWGGASIDDVSTNQTGFDQWLPLGGFLVYSAGTNLWAVSRQYQEGGLATDENGAFLTAGSKKDDIKNYLRKGIDDFSKGEVHQVVTIRLPKGKHIIRVASHLVSDGDVLKRGEIYNLQNNLYHLTSTNVFRFNDPQGNWVGSTELLIDVTGDQYFGEIFIADRMIPNFDQVVVRNVYGYLLDIPLFNVLGQVPKCVGMERQTVIIDPNRLNVYNDILPQDLETGAFATVTDHNGYFFFMLYYGEAITIAMLRAYGADDKVISKRSDTKYYGDIGQVYDNMIIPQGDTFDQGVFGSGFIYNNARQGNWNQSIPDDHYYNVLGQQASNVIFGAVEITQVVREVLILNNNLDYRRDYSTVVKGRVVDANGTPICCSNIVLEKNSRQDKSQDDGGFDILAFAEGRHSISPTTPINQNYFPITVGSLPAPASLTAKLIFNTGDCFVIFDTGELSLSITPFDTNPGTVPPPYSSTAFFDTGDIIGVLPNGTFVKAPKRGSKYTFVMRFQDGPGRMSTCIKVNETSIPFTTENQIEGYPIINWSIPNNIKPPKWAHKYQILRTTNLILLDYLQWLCNDVKYVLAVDTAGNPIETSYSNFDATQIWISIENLSEYYRQHPDSKIAFTPDPATQKVRFIYDEKDNLLPVYSDFDLIGYTQDGQWLKIKYSSALGEIKTGWRFEVYNRRKILEDEVYFECGECFTCTDPDTDNNDFSVRNGVFTWGDTYWVKRNVPIRDKTDISYITQIIQFMESPAISDFFLSDDEDIGRIGAVDPQFGEVRRSTVLRVSDNYATRANGLSAFRNIDDRKLDITYGPIRKLELAGFVLLAICENHTVSNYIGRVVAKSNEGETLQALTGDFIGDSRPLLEELGTQHPESVKEIDGYVYCFDARRGVVWRYAGNGQTQISAESKMHSYFSSYRRTAVWSATGVVDRLYKEYILTIFKKGKVIGRAIAGNRVSIQDNITQYLSVGEYAFLSFIQDGVYKTGYYKLQSIQGGPPFELSFGVDIDYNTDVVIEYKGEGVTIAYCEPKKRFTTRYSFMPESYGIVDNDMASFKDGKLWIHDKNELRNNFYGVQYTTQIAPIFCDNNQEKVWLSITVDAKQDNKKGNWSCPVITNRKGQLSRILNNSFEKFEEYFSSDFKKDLNTPGGGPDSILTGNDLRSSDLKVVVENDYTGEFDMRSVWVGVEISERNTN